tara:strand:- start:2604 stop:2945 length:342 start_codon:yes stop_codon:yes gene_type:complete
MSGLVDQSADARSKTIGANFRVRAWARIESNGTVTGSENISSVSASSGSYTLNFSSAMPNTNYSVCLSLAYEQSGYYFHYLYSTNTGNVVIKTQYESGNHGSFARAFSIAIFG